MGLSGLLNAVMPIGTMSRLYLEQQLRSDGIDIKSIPDACLQELADEAVKSAKFWAKVDRQGWWKRVTQALKAEARLLALIIDETRDDRHKYTVGPYPDEKRAILARHGVKVAPRPG
jgi:hypothetical protein